MVSTEFLVTSLIVVLLPGTGVIYTISTGIFQGARASLFAAFGCTAGIIPSLLACIFGLAAIIHTSALVFQALKFAGVAYLLYLAWGMWKDTGGLVLEDTGEPADMTSVSTRGFLINILNPKLSVFFMAFLPQFIPPQAEAPLVNMLALGAVFMAMTLFVFIFYGLLAHSVSAHIVGSPKIMKFVQRTFAATFVALGAKLAFTER